MTTMNDSNDNEYERQAQHSRRSDRTSSFQPPRQANDPKFSLAFSFSQFYLKYHTIDANQPAINRPMTNDGNASAKKHNDN